MYQEMGTFKQTSVDAAIADRSIRLPIDKMNMLVGLHKNLIIKHHLISLTQILHQAKTRFSVKLHNESIK